MSLLCFHALLYQCIHLSILNKCIHIYRGAAVSGRRYRIQMVCGYLLPLTITLVTFMADELTPRWLALRPINSVWSNSIVHPRPLNLFMRQCWWFSGWINCFFIELLGSIGPPTDIFIITRHGHVKVVLSGMFPYTYRLRYHNTNLKFMLPNIKARDFDSLISLVQQSKQELEKIGNKFWLKV